MQKQILMLTTSALILMDGVLAASAQQQPAQQQPAQQQPQVLQQQPQVLPQREQQNQLQPAQGRRRVVENDDDDYGGMGWGYGSGWRDRPGGGYGYGSGWRERQGWGRGMGMMGRGGGMGYGGQHGGMMMRMLFAMMDSDGDGTISLQEFQAAHERIFRAMDANKDGKLTVEEIQAFMRGAGRAAGQQQQSP